jgi:hypothetical protein
MSTKPNHSNAPTGESAKQTLVEYLAIIISYTRPAFAFVFASMLALSPVLKNIRLFNNDAFTPIMGIALVTTLFWIAVDLSKKWKKQQEDEELRMKEIEEHNRQCHLIITQQLGILINLNNENTAKINLIEKEAARALHVADNLEKHHNMPEKLSLIKDNIAPELVRIFKPIIDKRIKFLKDAINNKIILTDQNDFVNAYIAILNLYPNVKIRATSSIKAVPHFWTKSTEELNPLENAIKSFIAKGGKMRRDFFFNSSAELNDPIAQHVLARQDNLKVDVHTLLKEICTLNNPSKLP